MIWFIIGIILGLATVSLAWMALSRKAPDEPVYEEVEDGTGYGYSGARSRNENLREKYGKELLEAKDARRFGWIVLIGGGLVTAFMLTMSMTYSQSNGQVAFITRWGGEVVKADATMGWGTKAPWDSTTKWDIFTRDISLSEPGTDFETEFEKGEITASRIATAVASGEDSGAQVWFDLEATYNLATPKESPEAIEARLLELFKTYRSQDRFTRQLIYPALLNTANTVPSDYTTVQFRGAGSVEAAQKIGKLVTDELKDAGVIIATTTVSDVDFTEKVEESISKVEEKQQLAEEAKADADAQDVKNEQLIEDAKAKAEAYKEESDAITPALLAKWKIEAMNKGTMFVTQDDSDVILSIPGGNAPR